MKIKANLLEKNWRKICRIASCALIFLVFFFHSCSPAYLLRASYEEGKILLSRKKISNLLTDRKTSEADRRKFKLVLEAREFAKELGLNPKESFTKYSKINRDVLVWLIIAAPKTSLQPKTWWFPVVGSFPYKGFFEKEDALKEFENLIKQNFDVYLRPSAAFSTLGWFNDPLLSTTLAFDELSLANTVFHEITHSTVWIKDNAAFNETFAHVVGSLASIEFFTKKEGITSKNAERAKTLLAEDLEFANFLKDLKLKLNALYSSDKDDKQKLTLRNKIFTKAKRLWQKKTKSHFNLLVENLNNAVILAQSTYMEKPELFIGLHQKCNNSISCMIGQVASFKKKENPYKLLESSLDGAPIKK